MEKSSRKEGHKTEIETILGELRKEMRSLNSEIEVVKTLVGEIKNKLDEIKNVQEKEILVSSFPSSTDDLSSLVRLWNERNFKEFISILQNKGLKVKEISGGAEVQIGNEVWIFPEKNLAFHSGAFQNLWPYFNQITGLIRTLVKPAIIVNGKLIQKGELKEG